MRLIDADALIEEYGDWYTEEGEEHGFIGTIEDLVKMCRTIEPERKKGKWINRGRIIRCSKCGTGYAAVKGMKSALTYNFCPNCGADMRGERDG